MQQAWTASDSIPRVVWEPSPFSIYAAGPGFPSSQKHRVDSLQLRHIVVPRKHLFNKPFSNHQLSAQPNQFTRKNFPPNCFWIWLLSPRSTNCVPYPPKRSSQRTRPPSSMPVTGTVVMDLSLTDSSFLDFRLYFLLRASMQRMYEWLCLATMPMTA